MFLFPVALAFGVKESTKFNNFCTGVNLCVVLFVIISGSFKGKIIKLYRMVEDRDIFQKIFF